MKIFTRSVQLTSYILSFSLLGISHVWADTSFESTASPKPTHLLLAQTSTPSATTTQLTINPPLTSSQQATLKTIDATYQPLIKSASRGYKNRLKNLEALLGTNPSNDTILNRYNQAKEDRGEITDLLIGRALELRDVLTPAQRASMADDVRRFLEKQ